MKPVVAIVGRPNVGKSTLFNRLLGRRKAITSDMPGVTRDLNYADTEELGRPFVLVDTGGFESYVEEEILKQVRNQTTLAIEEADLIIHVMDGRAGVSPEDFFLVDMLRKVQKPVVYAVNKIDSQRQEGDVIDFYTLGVEKLYPVSAEQGRGLNELVDAIVEKLPQAIFEEVREDRVRVAIVGRPNVGKSSILNKLIGRERAIVSGVPGTTRDVVDTPFDRKDKKYLFLDTAGIRKKARISLRVESYSVMEAIRTIGRSDVVLLVIDAAIGVTGQDEKIAGLVDERGKCCIIVVNKWDLVPGKNSKTAKLYEDALKTKLPFLSFAPVLFISALKGQRVPRIIEKVDEVYGKAMVKVSTPRINEALRELASRTGLPHYKGRAVKFYYATQTGTLPPAIVIFTNYPEGVTESYRRYIVNGLRERLGLEEVPLKLYLRKRK